MEDYHNKVEFEKKMEDPVYSHEEVIIEPYKQGKQTLQRTIDRLTIETMVVTTWSTVKRIFADHYIELDDKQREDLTLWDDTHMKTGEVTWIPKEGYEDYYDYVKNYHQ